MNRSNMSSLWLSALVVIVLAIIAVVGYVVLRPPAPSQAKLTTATLLSQPRQLINFHLIDDHGKPFTNNNLQGQWSLLFFGFTHCPKICPTTLSLLNKVTQQLVRNKSKITVIFISVDPQRDSPRRMRQYLAHFNRQFVGVTGSQQQLDRLSKHLNIAYRKIMPQGELQKNYNVEHSSAVLLINPRGQWVALFTAPQSSRTMAKDLQYIINPNRLST